MIEPTHDNKKNQLAGSCLIGSSILMIFAMLHHPTGHGHDFASFVKEVKSLQTLNAIVHGGAIGIIAAFIFGFSYVSDRLGWSRAPVRVAAIAYGIGTSAMIIAAMVSGFLVPFFLERYSQATATEMEIATEVLGLLREANRAFDLLGVCGMSIGVACWSVAIFGRQPKDWLTGGLGLIVGLVGILGIFTGLTEASVSGILAFVLLQGVWNIRVGIQMLRSRW